MKKSGKVKVAPLLLSLGLFFLLFIKTVDCKRYPVLGSDMLASAGIVEDHRDALELWTEKGVRGAVLLNIDAHDDMKRVQPGEMKKLKGVYERRIKGESAAEVCQAGYGPVSNANFIYAAAKLGIVRKVIWVVPQGYGIFSDSGERLAELLKAYGFPEREIEGFELKGGCFAGKTAGIPLAICDEGALPDIREPLLLSIDTDFFPAAASADKSRIINHLKKTFTAVFAKGYTIRDAVVAYSVNGGYTSASYRWLGDLVADIIRAPGLIRQPELPDRYAFLQRADLLNIMGRHGELLNLVNPLLEAGISDPPVFLYAALACEGLGKRGDAFLWAEKACLADNGYCYGLPQIGTAVLNHGGLAAAERFFLRGYELRPGMDEGQFRFAMALKESGRYDEALRYFNAFRGIYGPFPVDFYMAETFRLKGDEGSALQYYDSGRRELSRAPLVLAGFGDLRIIGQAAAFYAQKGYGGYAMELSDMIGSLNN